MTGLTFTIAATDGAARTGAIALARGVVRTPAFMPVGTAGTVKAMYMDQVKALGADIILGNTYHLMLRPGAERVAALGGLHRFGNWPGPILTDSGGFQVMSLAQLRKLDETGVTFQSHIDGASYHADAGTLAGDPGAARFRHPHAARRVPAAAGAARRGGARHAPVAALGGAQQGRLRPAGGQGAVRHRPGRRRRGAAHRVRRRRSLPSASTATPSAGWRWASRRTVMLKMLETTCPVLPADAPRYLMGVGTPDDIVESVARGVDMFDCVMPTRAGRHGVAYTRFGKLNLKNARHADDPRPLDAESACPAARDYSRAYLHHLVKSRRDAGRDAAHLEQPRLLRGADGRHPRGDRRRALRRLPRRRPKAGWAAGDIPALG